MQRPDDTLFNDFMEWFKADEHSSNEDYYKESINKKSLSRLAKNAFIDFFYEFAKEGGKIQGGGHRTAGRFRETMENDFERFKKFALRPFAAEFDESSWIKDIGRFSHFGIGLATIYLNRIDKNRYAVVNNKSTDAARLFGIHVPTNPAQKYFAIRDFEQKLIDWHPALENLYRTDALAHFLIAIPQGQEWANRISGRVSPHPPKYWIYAPGDGARFWEEYSQNGLMGVGWDQINQDLSECTDEDDLRSIYFASDHQHHNDYDFMMLKDFLFTVSEGDFVFVKKGRKELVGYGEVTSGYFYKQERPEYRHFRRANWKKVGSWSLPESSKILPMKTLTIETNTARIQELKSLMDLVPTPPRRDPNPYYSLEQCSQDTFLPIDRLQRWVKAIKRKRQAVFYGPPGTGKTFIAEHLSKHLISGGQGASDLIQFHPSYAYEDFIQGIRPVDMTGGSIRYEMVPGRFKEFCDEAREKEGTSVFIVDELNRANLSRVFGELMYLLEYRDRGIPLSGGERFSIPENVLIIGTMNTADRSVALVDHALRRRFAFLELYPDYTLLKAYHVGTGFDVSGLVRVLTRINAQINDRNYHIGESFFLKPDIAEELEGIWSMEIEPYLAEFFFDQHDSVEKFRWDVVRGDVLP